MEVEFRELKGNVIHDFPYSKTRRKCPHIALISITHSGCCVHRCPMCYARAYPWSIEDKIVLYKNVPEKIEQEIKKTHILPPFYISQVSDALQPIPEVREITFKVVRILMAHKLSFHILTKSAEGALALINTLPALVHYPYWHLGMTIESPPEKQKITSPGASQIEARFKTLKKISSYEIPIVGRVDPTILGFLEVSEVLELIKRFASVGAKHIVGSLGYYNSLSMGRLLSALLHSKWKDKIPSIERIYGFRFDKLDTYPPRKRFRASIETRIKFHSILRKKVEALGLTYGVCLELPREYDSRETRACEGMLRNFVHIRRDNGTFYPVNCCGDCIKSCPNENDPSCGKPELQIKYPYKLRDLS